MPERNRVTPYGDIIVAEKERGRFMGNRGCLHVGARHRPSVERQAVDHLRARVQGLARPALGGRSVHRVVLLRRGGQRSRPVIVLVRCVAARTTSDTATPGSSRSVNVRQQTTWIGGCIATASTTAASACTRCRGGTCRTVRSSISTAFPRSSGRMACRSGGQALATRRRPNVLRRQLRPSSHLAANVAVLRAGYELAAR